MNNRNRLGNVSNRFQGTTKKVLCVCSAGLLRSPTAAVVLSGRPFHYNTRAAGVDTEFALIPVDEVLLEWADEIVCMEDLHLRQLKNLGCTKTIIVLDLEDCYNYRDPELMKLIAKRYKELTSGKSKN